MAREILVWLILLSDLNLNEDARDGDLSCVDVEAGEEGGIKPTEAGSIVLVTQCVGKKFGSGRWEVGGCPAANPRARLGEEI